MGTTALSTRVSEALGEPLVDEDRVWRRRKVGLLLIAVLTAAPLASVGVSLLARFWR